MSADRQAQKVTVGSRWVDEIKGHVVVVTAIVRGINRHQHSVIFWSYPDSSLGMGNHHPSCRRQTFLERFRKSREGE